MLYIYIYIYHLRTKHNKAQKIPSEHYGFRRGDRLWRLAQKRQQLQHDFDEATQEDSRCGEDAWSGGMFWSFWSKDRSLVQHMELTENSLSLGMHMINLDTKARWRCFAAMGILLFPSTLLSHHFLLVHLRWHLRWHLRL